MEKTVETGSNLDDSGLGSDDKDQLLFKYMELKTKVRDNDNSLLDHVLTQYEKLRRDYDQMGRDLRQEKARRLEAESLGEIYRLDYKNYLLSWTMEKAEAGHWRKTLEDVIETTAKDKQALLEEKEKAEKQIKTFKLDYQNYLLSWTMEKAEATYFKQKLDELSETREKEKEAEMEEKRRLEKQLQLLQSYHKLLLQETATLRQQIISQPSQCSENHVVPPSSDSKSTDFHSLPSINPPKEHLPPASPSRPSSNQPLTPTTPQFQALPVLPSQSQPIKPLQRQPLKPLVVPAKRLPPAIQLQNHRKLRPYTGQTKVTSNRSQPVKAIHFASDDMLKDKTRNCKTMTQVSEQIMLKFPAVKPITHVC